MLADLETLPTEDGNTLKNQIDSFLTALGYDTANVNAVDTGVLLDLLHWNISLPSVDQAKVWENFPAPICLKLQL